MKMNEGPAPETEKPAEPKPVITGSLLPALKNSAFNAGLAALLLTGVYFYASRNIAAAIVMTAAILYFFHYCRSHDACRLLPQEQYGIYNFLIAASVLILAFRFYVIFSFPYEYSAEELSAIADTYARFTGFKGFFSFSGRQDAAIPLIPAFFYTSIMSISGHRIDVLRLVPVLLSAATAAGLFMLGRKLKNRELGIIFLFLYACSGWAVLSSRELLTAAFIPFFTVSFLLCFYKYLETKNKKLLLLTWTVFFAGFFTYSSWILMAPFCAYLLYGYRPELGENKFKEAAAYLSISTVIAAISYVSGGGTQAWIANNTDFAGYEGNIAGKMLENAVNAWKLFILPPADGRWFSDKIPPLSFPEVIALSGGLLLCASGIKERTYRIFFTGFFLSLSTLFFSGISPSQHLLALPFIIIISGFFLDRALQFRPALFIITVSLLSFINVSFFMFIDWDSRLKSGTQDSEIAAYINKTAGYKDTIFFHPATPMSPLTGEYSVFLRARPAYEKISSENAGKALFTSSSLFRYLIIGIFPEAKIKYFYDYTEKNRLPTVLYDIDVKKSRMLRKYFTQAAAQVTETNLKFWGRDYDGAIKKCDAYCMAAPENPLALLKNTFLRFTQLKALEIRGTNSEIAGVLFNTEKPMFLTADWALRIAEAAYASGNIKDALEFVKTAAELAPEWKEPGRALKTMAANAGFKLSK